MTGSGTNVRALLRQEEDLRRKPGTSPYQVVVLVTDNADPKECKAREIAAQSGNIPVVELDIREFYRKRGEKRVTVATPPGRRIREEWTRELLGLIRSYGAEIGAFGGFVPLTNLCADLPCINIHPGDLSVLQEGKRYLVGLHTIPIKRAILSGRGELRSSTILATPYTEKLEMDEGPVLMISEPLALEFPAGLGPKELEEEEKGKALEQMARRHQERLKERGDWVIFPLTVKLVAEGRFGLGEGGQVYFEGRLTECGVKLPFPGLLQDPVAPESKGEDASSVFSKNNSSKRLKG